jgi:hypothetical protein
MSVKTISKAFGFQTVSVRAKKAVRFPRCVRTLTPVGKHLFIHGAGTLAVPSP